MFLRDLGPLTKKASGPRLRRMDSPKCIVMTTMMTMTAMTATTAMIMTAMKLSDANNFQRKSRVFSVVGGPRSRPSCLEIIINPPSPETGLLSM